MTTDEVLNDLTTAELLILMAELDRTIRELQGAGRPSTDTSRLRMRVDDVLYGRGA